MNLTAQLNKNEITQAIEDYVAKQGFDLSGKNVDIDMIATRKPKGFTATVTIGQVTSVASTTVAEDSADEEPVEKESITYAEDPEVVTEKQEAADNDDGLEAGVDPEESLFGS